VEGPGRVAGALDGVTVVELGGGIAGPFAARLLGDLGAEVFKVEPPGGDATRSAEPVVEDARGRRVSLLFEYLNWNKCSVVADLQSDRDRERVLELLTPRTIVIDALGPDGLEQAGLAPDTLRQRAPLAVIVSISSFGRSGPYAHWRGSDLVVQAMSGVMAISGVSDREPLAHGLRQSEYCTALNAAYVALAAHLAALRQGEGAEIDVSARECLASELLLNEAHYAFLGVVQGRRPPIQDPFLGEPLATRDGWISLQTSGLVSTAQIAEFFAEPRIAEERFATTERRTTHALELSAILERHLDDESACELFRLASERGLLSGFVQTAEDLLRCPQLEAREAFVEFADLHARGHPVRFPARLAELSATPTSVRGRAPALGGAGPRAGVHGPAGGGRAGLQDPAGSPSGSAADRRAGPLSGLRVIDLSTVFAVPYLGALLCDLGAEVIKIEAPHRLDQIRSWFGPFFDNDPGEEWWNRSATFQLVNRGKRSFGLDLSSAAGRDVLRQLIAVSDVMIDNFTPRVLRGWDLTYERLRDGNPGLVMLSNTGYGSTGPWSEFRAQGTTLEATMGISGVTGYAQGKPSRAGQSYPDFIACWSGLTMLMAALIHRERTGHGQLIDLGMYQLGPVVIPEALLGFQAHGAEFARRGSSDIDVLLSGLFRAAGDDRWLAVTLGDRRDLARAAALIPALAPLCDHDRWSGEDARAATDAIAAWALGRDDLAAATELQASGVAAGPVLDARDLLDDPQLRARRFYETVDLGPVAGRRPLIGRPYSWLTDEPRVGVRGPAPAFAADNGYVLRDLLALDEDRVAELYACGAVADAPTAEVRRAPQSGLDLDALVASGVIKPPGPQPLRRPSGSRT
jgi:crotonobetainyl-CoA:carnitine CoA-transferase CaiB-like acyl-CoA transferase